MFSSLDEQIKRDEAVGSSPRERWLRYCGIVVVSALVFGGLYAAIIVME
jgi:hypothetical protein